MIPLSGLKHFCLLLIELVPDEKISFPEEQKTAAAVHSATTSPEQVSLKILEQPLSATPVPEPHEEGFF